MLETIKLVGYALTNMSYNAETFDVDEGKYQFNLESVGNIRLDDEPLNGNEQYILKEKFKSEITGMSDSSDSTVFNLSFEFTIFFETTKETFETLASDSTAIESNQWFFANFAHSIAREIGESVFNHTSFKGLRLPSGRG